MKTSSIESTIRQGEVQEHASQRSTMAKVASVMFSSYPADPRPRRAAEALIQEGMEVDVLCLRDDADQADKAVIDGVNVTRIALRKSRAGKLTYFWQYGWFILVSAFILARRTIRQKYDLVHIHNMPDLLVFSAIVPVLFGARVILDLHDPMPELMMTIYGLGTGSRFVRLLKWCEARSVKFSDAVITVNETCRRIFSARTGCTEKISVVMNSPDERIFTPPLVQTEGREPGDNRKPFVIMYHGSLVERHGLDIAIEALAMVREKIPHAELRVYGKRTPFLDEALTKAEEIGVKDQIVWLGPKCLEGIVEGIRDADVGVIPNRRSIFTELNTPTRIFEYLSQGLPVIAPRAPGITDYFREDEIILFELGSAQDLARKITFAYQFPEEVERIVERGMHIYGMHTWAEERKRFVQLVDSLLGNAGTKTQVHVDQPTMPVAS